MCKLIVTNILLDFQLCLHAIVLAILPYTFVRYLLRVLVKQLTCDVDRGFILLEVVGMFRQSLVRKEARSCFGTFEYSIDF